jgi:hypothetical protein
MKDHPISTKMMIAPRRAIIHDLFQCGSPAAARGEKRRQAPLLARPYTRLRKKETLTRQEKSQLRALNFQ